MLSAHDPGTSVHTPAATGTPEVNVGTSAEPFLFGRPQMK